ncbi:hypothetical protein CPB84DRAFT_1776927 [Gymnopilus junonius]|uniref:HMG box domain-containing protein n=1 Tax=Gymnopilus junonius TaxID=109634 RepID=A0A9P5TNP3_GYMJU|nr:hypothetical protein CPB84DRAFT_1776927 [Gymnopilus junonius]
MLLDRGQDLVNENVEKDAMPPLVDNPSPNYTFSSGMTPLSFTSTPAPSATQDASPQPSMSLVSSPAASPISEDPPPTNVIHPRPHGKKRDPTHIPRPPNAFILFRCAFIKEQNIPGKVEGNHSRLSKIIGLCWKQLPPEEREKWEAKAVQAQADHRAQYPDWRFRPASNALPKSKGKDGGGSVTSRRRSVRSRDAEEEDGDVDNSGRSDVRGKRKERGSGKATSTRPLSLEEIRCAKIAGFVAEGLKGDDLEIAVKEWDGMHKMAKTSSKAPKSKGRGNQPASSTTHVRPRSDVASTSRPSEGSSKRISSEKFSERTASTDTHSSPTLTLDSSPKLDTSEATDPNSSKSVANQANATTLFDVPLTHMFRRSLSTPLSNNRPSQSQSSSEPSESSADEISPTSAEPGPISWGSHNTLVLQEPEPTGTHNHSRHDSIPFPMSSKSATFDGLHQLTWQEAENQRRIEEVQGPDSWWGQRSQATDPRFAYSQPRDQHNPSSSSSNVIGYGVPSGGTRFNSGYVEQYGTFESAQESNQRFEWGSSANSRPNVVTVVEDPYKDDCNANDNPPAIISPPPPLPHSLSSDYYQSRMPPPQTSPSFPSSSFSTLTGWAGDYKYQSSNVRSWPSNNAPPPVSSASPPGWYDHGGTWGASRSELHHPHLSMDSSDWDRIEHRAASDPHLQSEPPRQLDFLTELRRLHGGNNQS